MSLRQQLKADLPQALKARNKETVTALRLMLAAIDNAEAVEPDADFNPVIGRTNDVPRRELTEEQILQILQAEADKQREALAEYKRWGKTKAARQVQAELDVMAKYLGDVNS